MAMDYEKLNELDKLKRKFAPKSVREKETWADNFLMADFYGVTDTTLTKRYLAIMEAEIDG